MNAEFTVKVCYADGSERLWAATSVRMVPAGTRYDTGRVGGSYERDTVEISMPGDHDPALDGSIDSGRVFVMNRHGSTVSSYNLDQPYSGNVAHSA